MPPFRRSISMLQVGQDRTALAPFKRRSPRCGCFHPSIRRPAASPRLQQLVSAVAPSSTFVMIFNMAYSHHKSPDRMAFLVFRLASGSSARRIGRLPLRQVQGPKVFLNPCSGPFLLPKLKRNLLAPPYGQESSLVLASSGRPVQDVRTDVWISLQVLDSRDCLPIIILEISNSPLSLRSPPAG